MSLPVLLVCPKSTSEKISYHFIHAKSSVLFENTSILGIFIKVVVHFLLLSIIQHKCTMFNTNLPIEQCSSMSNLIHLLAPYVNTLRKYCTKCKISIPYVSIADIAYLLVKNKSNEWTISIDTNVYSKHQQFRLFNSVKYGKNNPLVPSTIFPFDRQLQYSSSDLLKKSLITFIEDDHISKIYFKNKKFMIDLSSISNQIPILSCNFIDINLINQYIDPSFFRNPSTNINTDRNLAHSIHVNTITDLNLSVTNIQVLVNFIQHIITSESSHQGYICSCVRGTYNKNILFFFFYIAGNYRYCPKKERSSST
ncbi:unnamed protein product [Rotaria sp. Silwood1]|nr:unnamed protein product [Rotaria sp. Silwood1]